MKLHPDVSTSLNTVTGYGTGYVEINLRRFDRALLVQPEGEVLDWAAGSFEALAAEHFEALLAHAPEIVILGTGERQRFPHPRLTAALINARIGVEVMDTRAACRTYNILMHEGRRVLAAMLPI
jgi:uncharacterized protein